MIPGMKVGDSYDCFVYAQTKHGYYPMSRRWAGKDEVAVLIPKADGELPHFDVPEPVRVRITRQKEKGLFVSDEYEPIILDVNNGKTDEIRGDPNNRVIFAMYDPAVNFLLWAGRCFEENHAHGKTGLNPERIVRIRLNGREVSLGYRHNIETIAGVRELLSRLGCYHGKIRLVRIPGEKSTTEEPTSMLEEALRIEGGIENSSFLRRILERHLISGDVPKTYQEDIQFLTVEQKHWGTHQARMDWPTIRQYYTGEGMEQIRGEKGWIFS